MTPTIRTAEMSDFEALLDDEYPPNTRKNLELREMETRERQLRLAAFPHTVLLQVAYPEIDYADRWCWQNFGPAQGECKQRDSDYPACDLTHSHSHEGSWTSHWFFIKTQYNYGYNEWCFRSIDQKNRFLEFFPQINWGEKYPK